MQLQLVLGTEPDLEQELIDVVPLVPSQLDDLPVFWVLNHRPIAGKFLPHTAEREREREGGGGGG